MEYRQPLEPLEKEIMEDLNIPYRSRKSVESFEEFVAQEEERRNLQNSCKSTESTY